MNIFHRWYCKSDAWRKSMYQYLPYMLQDVELGEQVLEIGPGPGVITDWLAPKAGSLTSIEIDHKLAQALRQRTEGTNVTVVEGDATAMEFADGSFDSAVCFTMLHHVPSAELQDRLLSEACRVLRPGASLIGSDSTPNLRWNIFHLFDTRVPADPNTFAERLQRAGFGETNVQRFPGGFSFRGTKN
ncbi:MAG: class I SAM-dependent methyltransferase [Dehalococcoidia bacterium]